mmetsp:Transcript_17394/g.31777  ORF Transcript_17394/g.31777 Transcript_17394/m.31777 type:complete len:146 (-) Transcript_17394:183-620(-)
MWLERAGERKVEDIDVGRELGSEDDDDKSETCLVSTCDGTEDPTEVERVGMVERWNACKDSDTGDDVMPRKGKFLSMSDPGGVFVIDMANVDVFVVAVAVAVDADADADADAPPLSAVVATAASAVATTATTGRGRRVEFEDVSG